MLIDESNKSHDSHDVLWGNRFNKLISMISLDATELLNSSYTNRLLRDIELFANWSLNLKNLGQNSLIKSATEMLYDQMFLKCSSAIEQFLLESITSELDKVYGEVSFQFPDLYPHNLTENRTSNQIKKLAPNFSVAIVNKLLPVYGSNPEKNKIEKNLQIIHPRYSHQFNLYFQHLQLKNDKLKFYIRTRNKIAHGIDPSRKYIEIFNFFYYTVELIRCINSALSPETNDPSASIQPIVSNKIFFDKLHILYNKYDNSDLSFTKDYFDIIEKKIVNEFSDKFKIEFVSVEDLADSDFFNSWSRKLENWNYHYFLNISSHFPESLISSTGIPEGITHSGGLDNLITNPTLVNKIIKPALNDPQYLNKDIILIIPKWISGKSDISNEVEMLRRNLANGSRAVYVEFPDSSDNIDQLLSRHLSGLIFYPTILIDKLSIALHKYVGDNKSFSFIPAFGDKTNKVNNCADIIVGNLKEFIL